jgi:hypothetical protein
MTRSETVSIFIILSLIFSASFYNFKIALRRSRDAQRKADARTILDAIGRYQDDFGYLPASEDGKIVACAPAFKACDWGKDGIFDISDPSYPPYLEKLPLDPDSEKGGQYYYEGGSKKFQVLASLEGKDEPEYDKKIEARGVSCGSRICNFGLSGGDAPLDKSVKEYENELLQE